jgi:hypothetical protein
MREDAAVFGGFTPQLESVPADELVKRLALLPSPHAVMPASQADVVAEGVVEIQAARKRLRELGAKGTGLIFVPLL